MKTEKIRTEDSFYDTEVRESLTENDEIDDWEAGFMKGYEEAL